MGIFEAPAVYVPEGLHQLDIALLAQHLRNQEQVVVLSMCSEPRLRRGLISHELKQSFPKLGLLVGAYYDDGPLRRGVYVLQALYFEQLLEGLQLKPGCQLSEDRNNWCSVVIRLLAKASPAMLQKKYQGFIQLVAHIMFQDQYVG